MKNLMNIIIEHTNKGLEAVKKMKKQMDDIMAGQNTDVDSKNICAQYRNAVQTKQKLFTRTQHK